MGKEGHHRQGDDGSLQEDDKQLGEGNGDLTAHDDAADLGHVDQLGHTGGGNHEPGELALDGACDDAGQEHICKANDNGLACQFCFGDLQQLKQLKGGSANA